MPPIRVLQIVPGLDPAYGGPTEVAINVCLAMRSAGIENTFLSAGGRETADVVQRLVGEGVELRSFDLIQPARSRTRRWGISPKLLAWMERHLERHDIVQVHGAWGLPQLGGLLVAKRRGRPCILFPHETLTSFDLEKPGNRLRPIAKRALKRLYLRDLSLVVFSSMLEARDSQAPSADTPIAVIPHPLRRALEVRSTSAASASGPLTVGYLGRLHSKKNVNLLIQALQRASTTARLRIAGSGDREYEQELRGLVAELGMDHRVEWVGFIQGDRRWDFLDSLDLLAMPSQYECFGVVGAEAMARGTPILVSRNTGVAELVERHGGGVVTAPTVNDVAHAVQVLEGDRRMLRRMGPAGRRGARQELSLDAYGRRLRVEYEKVLGLDSHTVAR